MESDVKYSRDNNGLPLCQLAGGSIISHPPLFHPDGISLYVIAGCNVKVFSVVTGQLVRQLTGTTNNIISVELELENRDHLVACTEAGEILRWVLSTNKLLCVVQISFHEGKVTTFNLIKYYGNSTTASAFITVRCNNVTRWYVISTKTGVPLQVPAAFKLRQGPVRVAVDTRNFKYIAITQGCKLHVMSYESWDFQSFKNPNSFPITALCVNSREESLLTGDTNGCIYLWLNFLPNQRMTNSLYHWHGQDVAAIAFSSSGLQFYSGGLEAVMVRWIVADPRKQFYVPRMSARIKHIAVSEGTDNVIVCMADNSIQVINSSFNIIMNMQEFTYTVDSKTEEDCFPIGLHLDPRSNALVLNGRIGQLQFYSPEKKSLLYNMDIVAHNKLSIERDKILYNTRVTKAAFTLNWMATGEVYNDEENFPELVLKFWEFRVKSQGYALNTSVELPHEGGFRAIEFSNNQENPMCATVGEDDVIKLWTLEDTDSVFKKGKFWYCNNWTSYKSMKLASISFSQDNSILAAGFGNTLCIYKTANLELLTSLTTCTGYEGSVQKAQMRITKKMKEKFSHEPNSQTATERLLTLLENFLKSHDKTLIEEIKASKFTSSEQSSNVILQQMTNKRKELIFTAIHDMQELNLFQKALIYQAACIRCKVPPMLENMLVDYLKRNAVSDDKRLSRLHEHVCRLNMRHRFKAKLRLANFEQHLRIHRHKLRRQFSSVADVFALNGGKIMHAEEKNISNVEDVDIIAWEAPCEHYLDDIRSVHFATGDCAHLVVTCLSQRVHIWNLLTLRLNSVLKLAVEQLALDPVTNLIAAFTANREVYIFQPNFMVFLYVHKNLPRVHGAIWMPRRQPRSRSLNVDWQAQSTLYFLTEEQEIVFFDTSSDRSASKSSAVSFNENTAAEVRYSTFGTFATKRINGVQNNIRHNGPLIIGVNGKRAVQSLIQLSTHTMSPLSLLCHEFIKTLLMPSAATESKGGGEKERNNELDHYDGDGAASHSHGDSDDEDTQSRRRTMFQMMKVSNCSPTTEQDNERNLRMVAEEQLDFDF